MTMVYGVYWNRISRGFIGPEPLFVSSLKIMNFNIYIQRNKLFSMIF